MSKQPRTVHGKVVAITGGARGIGKATAKALIAEGAVIAIGDLDLALAQETATELAAGTKAYELDVTDSDSFKSFLEAAANDLGPIDVLINNAGIMQLGSFMEEPEATAIRQIDINLGGVLTGTKLAMPAMVARGSGHIINIASQAGKTGYPGGATYAATKFGVVGLSEAVEMELSGTGVDISVVMPVVVNTELAAGVKGVRFVKNVEAEDVANAILKTVQKPRFDVHVPALMGPLLASLFIWPHRIKMLAMRLFNAHKVLVDFDDLKRTGYEDRASHSEPALDRESDKAA